MYLMKSIYRMKWAALFLLFALVSCKGNDVPAPEPLPEKEAMRIRWDVRSDTVAQSKALLDDDVLQTACAPGGESIGVWGKYTQATDGVTSETTLFDAVPLTYAEKTDGTTNNPYNFWNYPGEPELWNKGATYLFKACFPQTRMTELMVEIKPEIIQGTVNTAEIQEDLLVASAYVDTKKADLAKPVPLMLQHILSALHFSAQAKEGYDPNGDAVTSCWLQNQNEGTDLFSTSGYLLYSGSETSSIVWYPYESDTAPMYVWEYEGGLTFNDQGKTLLYTNNAGNAYTHNDGWVLVVPQTVKENSLLFCYTLKNAPGKVFSSVIPAITYQPGYKYSYVLTIGGANATLVLTVAPWNQLDSSYNIGL